MTDVLALDFDGLICDGLAECVLVTWNSHHGRGLDAFGDAGLGEVPADFVERFRAARSYARHLGHFVVPLVTAQPIVSQAEFDAAYADVEPLDVEAFVTAAGAYRRRARAERPGDWLRFHAIYPGLRDLLAAAAVPVYVVTAKDADSVIRILADHGIGLDAGRVYGELRSKVAALGEIAEREGAGREAVMFLDDSIANVVEARREGFSALWATWGYHAREHYDVAARASVPAIALADVQRLTAAMC
jgi:phosphoglycolate phosphatase-like HAD superfamily hydrolase